jgi:K+-sensing histidine kinase KdpD
MRQDLAKKKHDMRGALSSLYGVVEALKIEGFEFDSEDGRELLAQAEEAHRLLVSEIESCFQLISEGKS